MNNSSRTPAISHLASHKQTRRSVVQGLGALTGAGLLAVTGGRGTRVFAQDSDPAAQFASDVVYGEIDGQPLLLDVASPPARPELRPAVILIHPGGWTGGGRPIMADLMAPLAAAGYVAFNIEHRLFVEADGSNPWPAQLDDVQRAVRWIRTNAADYGVDPARIASLGTSAGGHLAAFLGTRETRDNSDTALADVSSRVTCVVDIAGAVDMTIPFADPATNATVAAILGGTAETPPDQAAYRDISPIAFVDGETVPFVIMHGGADTDLPIEHSRRMTVALREAGVEVISGEFPGYTHRSIFDWTVVGPETLAFLGRHLHPES